MKIQLSDLHDYFLTERSRLPTARIDQLFCILFQIIVLKKL